MKNYEFNFVPDNKPPREKLVEDGADKLSNAELLAIIFITGTRDENVLELSNRIIKEYGSRSITQIRDVNRVVELLGLGNAKACQLVATFELGRRFFREVDERMPSIRDPEDVYSLFKQMEKLKKEELRAIYLNSRQKIMQEELLSLGSENMNIISPKEILQPAVELMARGVIIIHNHPSGNPEPSDEDIKFTRRLKEASEILGIQLVDHVIIGKGFYSMKAQADI